MLTYADVGLLAYLCQAEEASWHTSARLKRPLGMPRAKSQEASWQRA
jgi:hypothetical protein